MSIALLGGGDRGGRERQALPRRAAAELTQRGGVLCRAQARVYIPDERFDWLCNNYKPKSKVPAFLEARAAAFCTHTGCARVASARAAPLTRPGAHAPAPRAGGGHRWPGQGRLRRRRPRCAALTSASLAVTVLLTLLRAGNAFLSHIRAVDGIFHVHRPAAPHAPPARLTHSPLVQVMRAFDDADVIHVEDRVVRALLHT
jgi:hypothetical protein